MWVYLPNPEASSGTDEGTQDKDEDEESCPSSLTQELQTGVIVSRVEDNTTIKHEPPKDCDGCSSSWAAPENMCRDQCIDKRGVTNTKVGHGSTSEKGIVGGNTRTDIKCMHLSALKSGTFLLAKDVITSEKDTKTVGNARTNSVQASLLETKGNETAKGINTLSESIKFGEEKEKHNQKNDEVATPNNGKICKLYVRQADGSFKPYRIPPHLYPLALEAVCKYSKQSKATAATTTNNDHKKEAKITQTSVSDVLKDVSKTVKAEMISQHSASSSSGCVGGVSGGASSVLRGSSHLEIEGTQQRLVENNKVATPLPGVKRQILLQGQKEITANTLKLVTASENSLHFSQAQRLSVPSSSLAIANIKNLDSGSSPIKVVALNQKQTGGIRLVMSNGQLVTLEKLKGLGLQVHTDGRQSRIVTSLGAHPPTTTTIVTSTISTITAATTTTTSTSGMVIQGDQVVAGNNMMQLTMSKGKLDVMQPLPFKMQCKKVSNVVSLQQLLLKGSVLPTSDASQKCSDCGGEDGSGGGSSLSVKKLLFGTKEREEQEKECSVYWEEYLG